MTDMTPSNPRMVPVPPAKRTTTVFVVNVLLAALLTYISVFALPKMEFGGTFIMMTILSAIYLVPSYIAAYRGHQHTVPILLVNIFFGTTGLGWIGALIWSSMPVTQRYEMTRY